MAAMGDLCTLCNKLISSREWSISAGMHDVFVFAWLAAVPCQQGRECVQQTFSQFACAPCVLKQSMYGLHTGPCFTVLSLAKKHNSVNPLYTVTNPIHSPTQHLFSALCAILFLAILCFPGLLLCLHLASLFRCTIGYNTHL